MQNMYFRFSLFLAIAVAAPCAPAGEPVPAATLNAVNLEVMSILDQDRDLERGGAVRVADLVEARFLPLFDVPRMAQTAMARNWRVASAQQQALLTAEFRALLVRTISVVLLNGSDWTIGFKGARMSPGDTEVRVKSARTQAPRGHLAIDYDMEETPAGWRVYDIKVGGASMMAMFRETFATAVRNEGVDGLLSALADSNRQARLGDWPARTASSDRSRIMLALLQSVLQGRR